MPTAKIETERDCRGSSPFTITDELVERFASIGQHKFKVALTNTPPMAERENDDIIVMHAGEVGPDGTYIITYADSRTERFEPMKVALEVVPFRQLLAEICRRPLRWVLASGRKV